MAILIQSPLRAFIISHVPGKHDSPSESIIVTDVLLLFIGRSAYVRAQKETRVRSKILTISSIAGRATVA